jgi:signal transduction histidine kinase
VREPKRNPLRGLALAALFAALVLGGATVAAFRSAPAIAFALLAVGAAAILVAVLIVAGRRVRRADRRPGLGEQLLESIQRPVFVVEGWRSGHPNLYVNRAYSVFTGYSAAEAIADDFDALGIFSDPAAAAAFSGLPPGACSRVTVRRRDGATIPARLELYPLLGDAQSGVVGMLRPDDMPPPDTGRPINDQRDAPPAAQGATAAFLSWLTHELRSPLNACVMWLDVLALAPQADKVIKAADAIKRNLARQTKLVNDLNDAARAAGGGVEVRLAPLDLVTLLRRNVDAWQLLAIARQLAFDHRIEPEFAQIEADPERLLQALNHLVDNAVASTPAGGRLEIRARSLEDTLVIEVEDTGGALSADDAAHMFEPLWRSAESTKSRAGLGLGLAIAHQIVAKHRGALTVSSGHSGAVFAMTLPLAAATAPPEQR